MRRLDQEIVHRGICESRANAQRAIKDGNVFVDDKAITKSSTLVSTESQITISDPNAKWVSRGAQKLLAILDQIDGKVALDLGASTGGFTQVLLDKGARHVFAVDVGHDQLKPILRNDPRVSNIERTNVKTISDDTIDHLLWPNFDIITCDLSFISLTKALPNALKLAKPHSSLYALVKPQFELSPKEIGKGGIVKSKSAQEKALENVCSFLDREKWLVLEKKESPIRGGDGNLEFLLAARKT